jgi:hypothetical protein
MPRGWDDEAGGATDPVEVEIGMRWAQLWRLARHPWVAVAFGRMLVAGEAEGVVGRGLGVRPAGPVVVQRRPVAPALDAWARDAGASHRAPWARFRREVGGTADWGVWHRLR